MTAITRAIHDPLGFPVPAFAAVKLIVFVACLPLLLLGVPALLALTIYSLAA